MVIKRSNDVLSAASARFRVEAAVRSARVEAKQWHLWEKQARQNQAQIVEESIETGNRRRRQSLRLVQQRRAAHARKRWPWRLATQFLFTDAEACLIDTLVYLASEHGPEFEAFRSKLENQANVRPSTQRSTTLT